MFVPTLSIIRDCASDGLDVGRTGDWTWNADSAREIVVGNEPHSRRWRDLPECGVIVTLIGVGHCVSEE